MSWITLHQLGVASQIFEKGRNFSLPYGSWFSPKISILNKSPFPYHLFNFTVFHFCSLVWNFLAEKGTPFLSVKTRVMHDGLMLSLQNKRNLPQDHAQVWIPVIEMNQVVLLLWGILINPPEWQIWHSGQGVTQWHASTHSRSQAWGFLHVAFSVFYGGGWGGQEDGNTYYTGTNLHKWCNRNHSLFFLKSMLKLEWRPWAWPLSGGRNLHGRDLWP